MIVQLRTIYSPAWNYENIEYLVKYLKCTGVSPKDLRECHTNKQYLLFRFNSFQLNNSNVKI